MSPGFASCSRAWPWPACTLRPPGGSRPAAGEATRSNAAPREDGAARQGGGEDQEGATAEAAAPSAHFLFTYGATVTGLASGETARVWLPVPPSNEDQDVKIEVEGPARRGPKSGARTQYGNEMLYVEASGRRRRHRAAQGDLPGHAP